MQILVHRDGRQLGPYSIDEVRARLGMGELFPTDLAWFEGSPSWVPLSLILSRGGAAESPAYPAAYPPAGYAMVSVPSTELATTSLVLGILSFFCFSVFTGIPAIICGHMARSRVRRAPAQFGGAGAALGGLLLGYFSLLPLLLIPIAIVLPKLDGRTEMAKNTAARTQISSLSLALESYEIDNDSYPTSYAGLNALVEAPANHSHWKGPYLKEIPQDPWGHAYIYRCPGEQRPQGFDLVSNGPDGLPGTSDDISNGE